MTPPENYNKAVETLQARLKEAAEKWGKAAVAVGDERVMEHQLNNIRAAREAYKQEYQEILNDLRELQNAVYPAHYVNLPGADVHPVIQGKSKTTSWGSVIPDSAALPPTYVMGGIASPAPGTMTPHGWDGSAAVVDRIVDAAPEILRRLETETPRPWIPPSENK